MTVNGQTAVNHNDRGGDIQIEVKEILPEPFATDYKTLSASPFKKENCIRINSDINGISVGSTTGMFGDSWTDETSTITFDYYFNKILLYIKQDWMSLFTKYIVIILLWSSLILLTREIIKFLRSK